MFLIIAVGLFCRKIGAVSYELAEKLNKLVFWIFTPVLLFNNIYVSGLSGTPVDPRLLVYIAAAILAVFGIAFGLTVWRVKENPKRGVMIQGIVRSNFVILGLPIVLSVSGPEAAAVVSVAASVVVPMYSLLAVFALETLRGGKVSMRKILLQVIKNPLMIGSLIGVFFMATGLRLPVFLGDAAGDMAAVAMPMGLFALGASIRGASMKNDLKLITVATVGRLIIVPLVVIPVGALLGFRGAALATCMAVFASPTAINSFTMAAQMGGDGDLAAGIVVSTSALSCVTIFLWTFALKQLGLM
jgi:predicted permease